MAAQRNFLLREIWFLKDALGKQAIPVLQQNAEWAEDRGPFQPTLMLAGQLVLFIKSKKISNWMPTSKISQTNTHMEGFCYQLCSTCANIIKHQVKVLQSWVFLRNKYSKKQWDFFSRACLNFSKKRRCVIHIPTTSILHFIDRTWFGEVVWECQSASNEGERKTCSV